MSEESNTPEIHVVPPYVYMSALALGYLLETLWPLFEFGFQWRMAAAVIPICLGLIFVVPAMVRFRKAATPFDVHKTATSLVTDGPYRYSRNPGYLALALFYTGIAILLGSVWVLMLLVPTNLLMNRWVIEKEEKHLQGLFGEEYLQYKSKVGRWL